MFIYIVREKNTSIIFNVYSYNPTEYKNHLIYEILGPYTVKDSFNYLDLGTND